MQQKRNIAVVGGGISGLSAAWLLSKRHTVTLYEAATRLGGHANTVAVETPEGPVAVDAGFIVYNENNYPNLVALFRHLDITSHGTEMSFAFSRNNGAYEYSGSGVGGFFGQAQNVFNPFHWLLLRDVQRFFATAASRVCQYGSDIKLGDFLRLEKYGPGFVDEHIVPMGSAIWSTSAERMLSFPARTFIDFYGNHGMLQFKNRPLWRSVSGGSGRYVERLVEDGAFDCVTGCRVRSVLRHANYVRIEDDRGVVRPFDDVVMATHADETLCLLRDSDSHEEGLLGAFPYQMNTAVVHFDPRWMPRRRRLWSSWNYLSRPTVDGDSDLCVTYWMNRLQNLQARTNIFVTLNPADEIHPKAVAATFEYAHPMFDANAMSARETLWSLQGRRNTWFCGSYFGYGFHEDGLQSGLAVAEQLGGLQRPWTIATRSNRIVTIPASREAA